MMWLLLIFVACTPELLPGVWGSNTADSVDLDQDGHTVDVDCDDGSASIHPGAAEVCDEVDQDCDGAVDEGVQDEAWPDVDGDGWGSEGDPWIGCGAPSGTTTRTGDCNDGNDGIHPDAAEICNGADDDCDTEVDEDGGQDGELWYTDADGDGYGAADTGEPLCDPAEGLVSQGGDCDDTDATVSPGAVETWYDGVDADCDGADDYDADQDGYDVSLDCDDMDAALSPGGEEICGDGIDNDCDGSAGDCALAGDFALSSAPASFAGRARGDGTGVAVCGPGDLDGDGRSDLVVSAPGDDSGGEDAGAVHAFLPPVAGAYSVDDAAATWLGDAAGAEAGAALGSLGDSDGDGQVSLIIGGPGADRAWVVQWPTTTVVDLGLAAATALSGAVGSEAGAALVGGSDHDGDGTAELWVGAPARDHEGKPVGGVYQLSEPGTGTVDLESAADRILRGESSYDRAGATLADLGDVDGDGLPDLLVGAAQDDAGATDGGTAYLVLGGSTHEDLADAEARVRGTSTTAYMGQALAGPGDLDGDGLDDVVVGAPGADEGDTNSGAAYVYLGGLSGDLDESDAHAVLHGEDGSDQAGAALAALGDFDGDGVPDLLVGAERQGSVAAYGGAAYVVLGPVSGVIGLQDAHARLLGQSSYDYAGAAVAAVGDPDWDGRQDLLVGAPGRDADATDSGAAWLVLASGM